MSSPPVKYARFFDFTTFAATNPEKPLPGASVDQEFNRLKTTTDQTIDRLALIQRDDGSLNAVIGTAQLMDGSVTEPKLADLSVSTRTLQALAVTTAKIALLAVGTGQLSDLAVTQSKLGLLSVGTPQLIDGAVSAAKLGAGAVTGAALGPGSVGTIALADLSVTQAKLSLLSVGTPQLIDGAVTSPKLGASLNFTGVPTAPTALTGTNTTQLATTAFVAASMSAAGLITEAPNDGKLYGRFALGWQRGVAVAGDTMTGLLLLSADPAAALGAATKQYVDAVQTLATGKVSKAGDTMTGNLGIGIAPPAWGANYPALCVGTAGAISGVLNNSQMGVFSNLFYDGATYKSPIADAGAAFVLSSGIAAWYTAPAVAAGAANVVTERMRLDASGNLGIGLVPTGANILDIRKDQNALTSVMLTNGSNQAAARLAMQFGNGVSSGNIIYNGAGYATSGIDRQDGMRVTSFGAGGLTLSTYAAPTYFACNGVQTGLIGPSGLILGPTVLAIGESAAGAAGQNYGLQATAAYYYMLILITWSGANGFALVWMQGSGAVNIITSSNAMGGNSCFDTINGQSTNGGNGIAFFANGGSAFIQTKTGYSGGPVHVHRLGG